MPLRLDSITPNSTDPALMAWILQRGTQECNSAFATDDKKYIHMRRPLTDSLSGKPVGHLVFTVLNNETEKQLEILDIDITLNPEQPSRIKFVDLLNRSDSNEYYEVESNQEQHLVVETVNRFTEPGELINTEREVKISMFPFQLGIYKDIDEYNREMGFGKPVDAGGTGLLIYGLSEKFCMPGSAFNEDKDNDDHYSLIIGTVKSFRDVAFDFGENRFPFVLAQVDTAVGTVPVAMGRDVFDLSELKAGCTVVMNTVVKADVAAPAVFQR